MVVWTIIKILAGILLLGGCVASTYPHAIQGEVTDTYWITYTEIEQYSQVRIIDSDSIPPGDAYEISKDTDCTYNVSLKITTCDTEYSWTMDRWVVVHVVENFGEDRTPVFPDVSVKHVEAGYGNQKIGKQYVKYFITTSFNKTCAIKEDLWRKLEVGSSIKTLRLGVVYTLCRIK